MINFCKDLLEYCKKQALAGQPLETCTYDESEGWVNMSIYDEAFSGRASYDIYKTPLDAVNFIRWFKFLACPGQPDYDELGNYYDDYCDALCRYLALIDYMHIQHRKLNMINYDFYQCCRSEGLVYNRDYYIREICDEINAFIGQLPLFKESDLLKHVVSEIKRTKRYCESNVALKIDGNRILMLACRNNDDDQEGMVLNAQYDGMMSSDLFTSEILPKLPRHVADALIERSRERCQITELALYIRAIKQQYKKELPKKCTYSMFELALDIPAKTLSKILGKKKHKYDLDNDKTIVQIKENFPKFKL